MLMSVFNGPQLTSPVARELRRFELHDGQHRKRAAGGALTVLCTPLSRWCSGVPQVRRRHLCRRVGLDGPEPGRPALAGGVSRGEGVGEKAVSVEHDGL